MNEMSDLFEWATVRENEYWSFIPPTDKTKKHSLFLLDIPGFYKFPVNTVFILVEDGQTTTPLFLVRGQGLVYHSIPWWQLKEYNG